MKNLFYLICTFLSLFFLLSCDKKDDTVPGNFTQPLPEATQNGAVMFACYVNGKAYICKGYELVVSYYQWVNGAYVFIIRGLRETDLMWSVEMGTKNSSIEEGTTYILNGDNPGYWGGGNVYKGVIGSLRDVLTDSNYTGEMTITKFDLENEIVSGTFWFDLKNPHTGERIEIRQGRFDTHFSQ